MRKCLLFKAWFEHSTDGRSGGMSHRDGRDAWESRGFGKARNQVTNGSVRPSVTAQSWNERQGLKGRVRG